MSNRYSRVRRGALYKEALDNYVQHLQTMGTRQPKLNSRGALGDRKQVFLTPFDKDLDTDEIVETRMAADHWTVLGPFINDPSTNAELLESRGSKTVVSANGFSPARLTYFRNSTRSVTVKKSEVTKMDYLSYNGDRYSAPFGRKAAGDDEADCAAAIRAQINTDNASFQIRRISFTPERWRAR